MGLGLQEKRSEVLWQALERAIPDVRERVKFKLVSCATSKSIDQCHAQCTGLPAAVGVGIRWAAAGARPADGVPCFRMCCNVRRLSGLCLLCGDGHLKGVLNTTGKLHMHKGHAAVHHDASSMEQHHIWFINRCGLRCLD